jgi:hypothetical protein
LNKAMVFAPAVPPKLRVYLDQLHEHVAETRLTTRNLFDVEYVPPRLEPGVRDQVEGLRAHSPGNAVRDQDGGTVDVQAPRRTDDNLVELESALRDLSASHDELKCRTVKVGELQKDVRLGIQGAVDMADEVLRSVNQSDQQQLQFLEDRFFRLRAAVDGPTRQLDWLWLALSVILSLLFRISWAIVSTIRGMRDVVLWFFRVFAGIFKLFFLYAAGGP